MIITAETPIQFNANICTYCTIGYDSVEDQVVIVYQISTTEYIVAGTINGAGTDITWGTPVVTSASLGNTFKLDYHTASGKWIAFGQGASIQLFSATGNVVTMHDTAAFSGQYGSICQTAAGFCAVINDTAGDDTGRIIAGTITGTSISLGSSQPIVAEATDIEESTIAYDPVNDIVLLLYKDDITNLLKMCTVTVVGNAVTVNAITTESSFTVYDTVLQYDSSTGGFLHFGWEGNFYYLRTISISGTTATASIRVVGDSTSLWYYKYNSAIDTNVNYMAIVSEVSSTLGLMLFDSNGQEVFPPEIIYSHNSDFPSVCYVPSIGKLIIAFEDQDDGDGKIQFVTLALSEFWTNFKGQTETSE